jgi:hypothetical protein
MNKEMYWKVFLKTDKKYRGLLWKKGINDNYYNTVEDIVIGDINTSKNKDTVIFSGNSLNVTDFEKVRIIQVLIDNEYNDNDDCEIILSIVDTSNQHKYYYHKVFLIHFSEKQLNEWQTGLYNFEIPQINDPEEKIITLGVKPGDQNDIFKNVRIKYLKFK